MNSLRSAGVVSSRPVSILQCRLLPAVLSRFQQNRVAFVSSSTSSPHLSETSAPGLGALHESTATDTERGAARARLALTESSVSLARKWTDATRASSQTPDLVTALASSPDAVGFVMKFTDWVMRPSDPAVAARALNRLVVSEPVPNFFSSVDALLIRLGAALAPYLPAIVVNTARLRMRSIVSAFVGPVERMKLDPREPFQRNVNLLGEAVLGDREAAHRREEAQLLLRKPGVNYVSVKVSGVTSQLNRWDFEGSLDRVRESLRPLLRHASESEPRVLVNLDMEEYHDLEITVAAFTSLLEEEEFVDLDAGIVLQTYLPNALPALQDLVNWANNRPGSAEIKIRLVKGANLAMEKVDAAMHGWEQAPYESKSDTDANYLRCLEWVLTPERTRRVRIGVASHNMFLLAFAHNLAAHRNVQNRVGFEMLQGMTPVLSSYLSNNGHDMLLYTPVCRADDFDVAISYLFRRFEETSADGNFLRSLPGFAPDSSDFMLELTRFRTAVAKMNMVSTGPRRKQLRPAAASEMTTKGLTGSSTFLNEPDTDPALPPNRAWALEVLNPEYYKPVSNGREVDDVFQLQGLMGRARSAVTSWGRPTYSAERRKILASVADVLARRRGELINAMVFEGRKTFAEADSEVSEAIDFAHYYANMAEELPSSFEPFGVVSVTAPWNFPVAISCGGVFAALAAGNSVFLKPSPLTPRCGELVAECAWEGGVPQDVLQFVLAPENEVGRELVETSDAVILTGSSETADLFRSWKPEIRLFAETSGKNCLLISPAADLDLAVADLVASAFLNTGQKCSASSLAVCIGDVYTSDRFRRQLRDAVESLVVGDPSNISTIVGPLISPPDAKLRRALTQLEAGEEWLVEPQCLDADKNSQLWTPGVKLGVRPGSSFHLTEVFGPVLGIMQAKDLDDALNIQNATAYGLTGGIHSLDNTEITHWTNNVEVGNGYVNRGITGAMVRRQSFGGWKSSVVGPGAKAGGPNYVAQFGITHDWDDRNEDWLNRAICTDERAWADHFSKEQDPTSLFCESNIFRYRPLPGIAVREGPNANRYEVARVRAAIERCGVNVAVWSSAAEESDEEFAAKLRDLHVPRVRVIGDVEEQVVKAAASAQIHVAQNPVVGDGRVELQNYVREQAISETKHRFGNLVMA